MRKALLLVCTVALALCAAQIARADASYTDPTGDSTTAPDVTTVTAANDAAGNLTFTVRTNQPTLAADAVIDIAFDIDHNPQTGGNGVDSPSSSAPTVGTSSSGTGRSSRSQTQRLPTAATRTASPPSR